MMFPKRNNDKQGNSNNHFNKGQRNNSGNPQNASQTKKSRLLSAIHRARSRGAIKHSLRKFCTNNTRCARSDDIRSLSALASASHSMLHRFLKMESKRIRRTTTRVTSRGLKISKT
jgi:hypothetical protein